MLGDRAVLGIPGIVDHDRPAVGVIVGPVAAIDPHREAVFAVIGVGGGVGTVRGRFRARLVGEVVEETRMLGIRALAMGDAEAVDLAADKVDDVKARLR